jgi:hypothetical protein
VNWLKRGPKLTTPPPDDAAKADVTQRETELDDRIRRLEQEIEAKGLRRPE